MTDGVFICYAVIIALSEVIMSINIVCKTCQTKQLSCNVNCKSCGASLYDSYNDFKSKSNESSKSKFKRKDARMEQRDDS